MASPAGPLRRALNAATRAAKLGPRDRAALELARRYADDLDLGGDLDKLGPRYLAALEALGLTPHARGTAKGASSNDQPDPLDEIAGRRARKRHAQAVDAAAP